MSQSMGWRRRWRKVWSKQSDCIIFSCAVLGGINFSVFVFLFHFYRSGIMTWSFLPALVVAWAGRHQLPSTFQPLWICFQFWWSYFTFVTMVWRQMQCCRRPHFSSWECAFFLRRYFFGWCIFWFGFRPSWVVTQKSPSRLDLHLLKQWFPFSTWSCGCYVSKFVRCWFQLIGSSFKKSWPQSKEIVSWNSYVVFPATFLAMVK